MRLAAAFLIVLVGGCRALPDVKLGACGNHIVDKGEDCDSPDARCIPPGQTDACRLRCDAFANGICPAGSICDGNGACIRQSGVCGNRVVEAGEDCDGTMGCIAPGQAGACHMSCAAYVDSRCPPKSVCNADGACVAAPDSCGNGFVDPGEQCDGGPDCIAAGQPGACQLKCAANPGGHCPAGSVCGANGACASASGTCGNLVVESGEDCDGSVGCGAPGTATACRFTCATVSCSPGYVCGNDKICRMPTGYYNLSMPPVGRADEAFAVSDLDGDGTPDLIGRGPHETTLWRNDGTGALSTIASGKTPPRPMDRSWPSLRPAQQQPAVALTTDGDTRILAALTGGPAELFRVHMTDAAPVAAIEPLITPSQYVPTNVASDSTLAFLALLPPTTADAQPTALFQGEHNGSVFIEVYQPTGYPNGEWNQAQLDVASVCGHAPTKIVAYPSAHGSAVAVTLLLDGRYLCLGELGSFSTQTGGFTFHTIDIVDGIARLRQAGWPIYLDANSTPGQCTTLDMNGDGRMDVMCALSRIGDLGGMPYHDSAFLYWLRNSDGSFPAMPYPDEDLYYLPPTSSANALVAQDLDGDKRDDVVFAGVTFQSVPPAANVKGAIDTFALRGRYEYPPVQPSDVTAAQFGDVAGTGHAALVQGFLSRSDLIVCRAPINATGFPNFVCDDEATGLTGVTALALADVNGDGRADMLAAGRGTPAWGGGSAVSIVLGTDGIGTAPAPILLPAYHGTVRAIVPAPRSTGPSGFTVLMEMDNGSWGLAQSYTDAVTGGSFGIGGSFNDARISDYDGDGYPDLALAGDGVTIVKGPELDLASSPFKLYQSLDHFLDVPGEPHPLAIGFVNQGAFYYNVSLGWYGYNPSYGGPYVYADTGLRGEQWASKMQDVRGDGSAELVAYDGDCNVAVGAIVNHLSAPKLIAQHPGNYHCADVFFVDVPPLDGVPDVLYEVRIGAEPTTHLLLSRARADGTYDGATPELDPNLAKRSAAPQMPGELPPGAKWVATQDMNGDGIADLVLWTPDGAIVALADVVRR